MLEVVLILLATAFLMALFVIFFSAVCEAVVEYVIGIPADHWPWLKKWQSLIIPVVSIGLCIVGAFRFDLDIFYIFGVFVKAVGLELAGVELAIEIGRSILGILLTGVLMSRGSNFVHEFFKRYLKLDTALKEWAIFGEKQP